MRPGKKARGLKMLNLLRSLKTIAENWPAQDHYSGQRCQVKYTVLVLAICVSFTYWAAATRKIAQKQLQCLDSKLLLIRLRADARLFQLSQVPDSAATTL